MEFMSCPNLAVPAEVMQHVARIESGFNPFAIGVVGGQLQRQPHSLDEALATVRMLESRGYDFSVGLAQVNRANLGKYGLDSYEKAFAVCPNLTAGADILARCYASAGGDWGKSFSCYYSGNFVTGYRDGYVQKIFSSFDDAAPRPADQAGAIPLQLIPAPSRSAMAVRSPATRGHGAAYRLAIRSVALGAVTVSTLSPPAPSSEGAKPSGELKRDDAAAILANQAAPPATPAAAPATSMLPAVVEAPVLAQVFEPSVRSPNDVAGHTATAVSPPAPAASVTAATGPSTQHADHADLRQGGTDAAFVF
jgi:type IV secretion system protein VirB1